jgi:hypothetical protein
MAERAPVAWAAAALDEHGELTLPVQGADGYEAMCTLALALESYVHSTLFAEVEIGGDVRVYEHGYDTEQVRVLSLCAAPLLDGSMDDAELVASWARESCPSLSVVLLSWEQRCHAVAEAMDARRAARESPLGDQ